MTIALDSSRGYWRTGRLVMARHPTARMIRLITTARTGFLIKMSVNDFIRYSLGDPVAAYLMDASVFGAGKLSGAAGETAGLAVVFVDAGAPPGMTPAPARSLKEPPAAIFSPA